MRMSSPNYSVVVTLLLCLFAATTVVQAEDPYLYFTWNVNYDTLSPLGVPQQVIVINGQFPGPTINCTSNNNIVVNVFNNLDEPFLLTWNGIQQRKNSWQEGLPGTNCPIPAGTNFTYHFQVKDQIGSYFYYPSTSIHRAAGGFGMIRIHSRDLIPVPFPAPEDEYDVLVGDWYSKSISALKKTLDDGVRSIGKPNGVIINGKDAGATFTMKPGKTYRYRFCNVGLKNSINVRIQGHPMKLVEIEGSHTVQNVYDALDLHLGQCLSVLVNADQDPKQDYYMVASTRFTKTVLSTTATIAYDTGIGGKGAPASSVLPEAPTGWAWSLNQFRSFRWNLTASAARPNPQGSYHYGQINITRTIKLVNTATSVDGKLRYAVNGVSHTDPETPMKLAEYYGVEDKVFKYNLIDDEPAADGSKSTTVATNVLNATFRNFVEIIFENHEKNIQSWHLAGYSFFPVAIEVGTWTPEKRKNYNLLDAVSRNTIHVYPKSWAAIMTTFDNAGMWNLRSMALDRHYLGQQLYISVLSPEHSLRDEYNVPDDALLCGIVQHLPKPAPYSI